MATLEQTIKVPQKRKQIPWSDYKEYMEEKRKKLNDQFKNMGERKSSIFSEVTIYVNGFTDPGDSELKKLIHLHGGKYSYKHSSDVTHVITSCMPDVKVKTMPNIVVVTPQWILDSIEARKQIPVDKYRLYSVMPKNQKQLSFHQEPIKNDPVSTTEHDSPTTSHCRPTSDLVSEFYAHSRLHHLSTWANELKQYVSTSIANRDNCPPMLQESESLKGRNQSAIVHFDFDCFFASVSTREKPELTGKPVVVTHAKLSNTPSVKQNSMADIASCNYEARQKGIRNGMHLGRAIQICPELTAVPYDFDKYHKVSLAFYDILLSRTFSIEAVSCDEAYVDLADYAKTYEGIDDIVQSVRLDVKAKTGCNLSAGIGPNILLARMATRAAKPNGQFRVSEESVESFMAVQKVEHLPGVGHSLSKKLHEKGIFTCQDVMSSSLSNIQAMCGPKTGLMLYDFARGKDDRNLQVSPERKSLSAEINFGIRPKVIGDVESIIRSLSVEVEKRATDAKVRGALVTLKLKVRSKDAPSTTKKYLGHGQCDNVSRSLSLPKPTRSAEDINAVCLKLLHLVKPSADSVRGLGIQIGKLTEDSDGQNNQQGSLHKYIVTSTVLPTKSARTNEPTDVGNTSHPRSSHKSPEKLHTTKLGDSHKDKSPVTCCEEECSFAEMKTYLQVWIENSSTSGPSRDDVTKFATYCTGLVEMNLEGVYLLLRWFRKALSSYCITAWYSSYNDLLRLINQEVSRTCGGPLKIDNL